MQGYIVVITRNGSLGGRYPLTSTECLFGQSPSCDVRVYVANVARKHCLITAQPNERAYIRNLSPSNTTLVNGIQIGGTQYELQHADVITVGERHFRWEYPFSSNQKTPARKAMDGNVHKTPTCMVQVPMSVFKTKRHSSPGVLRENKIISITSQDGVEPHPKRRKTLHNVEDLDVGEKMGKPVNKELVSSKAVRSPKNFNALRVLLKSASKRKSLIPISKTPKPQKRVISTKVNRSKSLTPQKKLSPKQKSPKYCDSGLRKKPVDKMPELSSPPLKSTKKKYSISAKHVNKNTPLKISSTIEKTNMKIKSIITTPSKVTTPKSSGSSSLAKGKTRRKTPRGRPSKTPGGSPAMLSSSSSPNSRSSSPVKDKTPGKSPRGRPSKTPGGPPARLSPSPKFYKSSSLVKDKTPVNTPRGRSSKTLGGSPVRLSASASSPPKISRSSSLVKNKNTGKTPRGRPSKRIGRSPAGLSASPSPKSSRNSSLLKKKTPGKTPKGRPSKTPKDSSVRLSASQFPKTSRSSSPVKDKTPGKTPRGRPSKTPGGSTARLAASPSPKSSRSISPVKHKTPGKTPRGRPSKTRWGSPARLSASPFPKTSRSSSPVKDKTPGKTPRDKPAKTPGGSPARLASSPSQTSSRSSSPVKDKTPGKTPRGRPSKTPVGSPATLFASPSPNSSRSNSPVKDKTPGKTPRGRPSTTPVGSPATLFATPSPKSSRSISPVKDKTPGKTPGDKPSKTPGGSPARLASSPSQTSSRSSSPVKDKTPGKTPRGRPSKISGRTLAGLSASPRNSSLVKEKTPVKTPSGRPSKTPKDSSVRLSASQSPKSSRSSSPVKDKTPGETPGDKPSKTPGGSPARLASSPPSPKSSRRSSPVKDKTPGKTQRGRPSKTPVVSPATLFASLSPNSSRNSSPVKDKTPGKTPRGRPSKTPVGSPATLFASPSHISSRSSSPVKDKTPGKTPRGRPSKTPVGSPTTFASPSPKSSRSSSPMKDKTPEKTPRGRPSKTPVGSPTTLFASPSPKSSRSSSPMKDKTPGKTSRGRPSKTPVGSPTTLFASPSPKSPRGRPSKTPVGSPATLFASPSPKSSRSSSPLKDKTPGKTPRGRPSKTPEGSFARLSASPSPKSSRSSSPVKDKTPGKTPRGRPSKTPVGSPATLFASPSPKSSRSSSPVKDKTPGKSPRGRPSKTPVGSPATLFASPSPKSCRSSSPVKDKTPEKTPRGRPSKTPECSFARLSASPSAKSSRSSSPVKDKTPGKTPRGRPSKTPGGSPVRLSVSPSPKSSRSSSPLKNKSPGKTPRGRPKSYQSSLDRASVSSSQNLSRISSLTKSTPKLDDKSEVLSSPYLNRYISVDDPSPSINNLSIDHSFRTVTDNGIEGLSQESSNVTKSVRRSALRSGLSSSKDLTTSTNNPLMLKSSIKKTDIAKLQIDSKRKYDVAEARAERAAKRLKMETPKSLTKNKKAALLVCHSPKSQKRPLFSEVLKSHLSTVKRNLAAAAAVQKSSIAAKRAVKQISFQQPLSLEVPTSFKFNSTGHANSPETIVIRKKIKGTPVPRSRKGRKSHSNLEKRTIEDRNLEGVSDLLKTPKSIISSLKSASSVKKSQNVRVRFSLQNDVQSPSGRRSSVMQSDETTYFGSPMVPNKRYIGTPRPVRFSESSLMHTSIIEESPLAQEIETFNVDTNSSKRKSNTSPNVSNLTDKSYDFSVYSPSSPTLQFSRISGVSSVMARKSIDFTDSPVSGNSIESPKRKRSLRIAVDSVAEPSPSSSKRFSFASVNSYRSRNSAEFQPSKDSLGSPSHSDIDISNSVKSDVSHVSCLSRKSSTEQISTTQDFEEITNTSAINISQIPLPHSPARKSDSFSSSISIKNIGSNNSLRSTRSSKNKLSTDTPTSLIEHSQRRKSKSQVLNLTGSSSSQGRFPSSSNIHESNKSLDLSNNSVLVELPKRISSTPKVHQNSSIYSPISSPISILDEKSLRSTGLPNSSQGILEESSFTNPLPTPGKKPRKGSIRMNASNADILTPESQVPVAAIKPSTRKKQGIESYSVSSESVSLPEFSVSHDVSERSVDRSLAQKIMDSRVSSGLDQTRTSKSFTPSPSEDQSNLSLGSFSSSRRKRKLSASTSTQSTDATTFDFTSAMTPKIPREMFVSPLDKVSDDLTNISGVKRILSPKGNSPVSSYEDLRGIKKLLKTPKNQNDLTDVAGIKRVLSPKANSPISSYIDVKGVKRLLKTPQPSSPLANYASIDGIKELFRHSPVADYTNVAGVKNLYSASVEPNYMNVKGVRRIFKETKVPNSPDIAGVEVLFESPKKLMDDYSQPSTSKPVGMVPPMSRQSLSLKALGDSKTVSTDFESVTNEPVIRNAKNTSQQSSRRRTLVTSLRKSKRTNECLQMVSDSVILSSASEKVDNIQVNQTNEEKSDDVKVCGRRPRSHKVEINEQSIVREEPEIEIFIEDEIRVTRKGRSRPKGKKNIKENYVSNSLHENQLGEPKTGKKIKHLNGTMIIPEESKQKVCFNTEPHVGRPRRTRHQGNVDPDEIPGCSNEINKEITNIQKNEVMTNESEEKLEPVGRKTRGRAKNPIKQELSPKAPSHLQKSKRLRVQETNVQSPENFKINKAIEGKTKIKGSDTAEIQREVELLTESKQDKANHLTTNSSVSKVKSQNKSKKQIIENEFDLDVKKDARLRSGQENKIEAILPDLILSRDSTTNSEKSSKEPERRGKRGRPKAQEETSKSPEAKRVTLRGKKVLRNTNKDNIPDDLVSDTKELPKITSRNKKTVGKKDNTLNSESNLREPSTSQAGSLTQENHKVTRRRVQFDMCLTVYCTTPLSREAETVGNSTLTPKKSSPKKEDVKKTSAGAKDKAPSKTRSAKAASTSESTTPEKKVLARKVTATKTKSSPKIQATSQAASSTTSESTTPEKKKVPARKVTTKTKASPKLKATVKAASSTTSESTTPEKKKVPARNVTIKTKASPKLKATVKAASSASKITTPEKKEPGKEKSSRTKATHKLKAVPKTPSPTSNKTMPEVKDQPTTKRSTRTRASPKLKAAPKVASPTLKDTKSTKKVPVKKVTVKTKAPPKMKATTQRKSSTPVKSSPAKRVTRSRK